MSASAQPGCPTLFNALHLLTAVTHPYTSAACRARIDQAKAVPSFSRHGNPYDNAQAEVSWSTLKTKLLPPGTAFAALEEARLEVAHYLDSYFNLDRCHSALG